MSAVCGQRFGKPQRICELDAGHEGACAGRVDPAIYRAAKDADRAFRAAQGPEPEADRNARLLLTAARLLIGDARALLKGAQQLNGGAPLCSFGRPLRVREARQILAKLCKEQKLIADGDVYTPAA